MQTIITYTQIPNDMRRLDGQIFTFGGPCNDNNNVLSSSVKQLVIRTGQKCIPKKCDSQNSQIC